jgi:hypothetical protein
VELELVTNTQSFGGGASIIASASASVPASSPATVTSLKPTSELHPTPNEARAMNPKQVLLVIKLPLNLTSTYIEYGTPQTSPNA